jgi:hypothetical protein
MNNKAKKVKGIKDQQQQPGSPGLTSEPRRPARSKQPKGDSRTESWRIRDGGPSGPCRPSRPDHGEPAVDGPASECVVVVKQHMPWDGLNGGRTGCWWIRERGTS